MAAHQSRLHQLVDNSDMDDIQVSQHVIMATTADMPVEANFFPGVLEGLLVSLGINALGGRDPRDLPEKVPPNYGLQQWWMLSRRQKTER